MHDNSSCVKWLKVQYSLTVDCLTTCKVAMANRYVIDTRSRDHDVDLVVSIGGGEESTGVGVS